MTSTSLSWYPYPRLTRRIPPVIVGVGVGALAWGAARAFPALTLAHAARPWLATVFVLAGLACSLSGVVSFRRARTTVNPMQPEAATTLVVAGLYRVTRNPMYLGFLFLLLGEIAWLANPVALVAAPALVLYLNRFQIAPEERALRARFGAEYVAYAARVRRWL